MDKKIASNVENLVGIAAIFSLIVGFIALLAAIVAFFRGEYSAVD